MAQLEPAVEALHIENRTDLVAFQLSVRVVIDCTTEPNSTEEAAVKIEFALQVNTSLFEIDPD